MDFPGLQTWKKREESIWLDMEAMGKTCILLRATVTGSVERRQSGSSEEVKGDGSTVRAVLSE